MSSTLSTGQRPAERELSRPLHSPIKRRSFFRYAGATAGVTALVLAGCNKDNNNSNSPGVTDVGGGDFGVLNYAYALEQLEAAFYQQVLAGTYFAGASPAEKALFTDLALHEKIHVDFFKAALGTNAIKALMPNFSAINFNDRTSVLTNAQAFEDLGVSAYNGAGRLITDANYLTLAGKIVSVEARHAALIRDTIAYNSFVGAVNGSTVGGDVIDPSLTSATARQEKSRKPVDVLVIANTFLADGSKVSANSLVY